MKKAQLLIVLILPITLFCCRNNSVSEIYINNNTGNDKFPGSVKRPIKTISEVNGRLKKKPASIFLKGGQVFKGNLLVDSIIGTRTDTIVIGSYGEGRAVIDGANGEAIRVENCSYIRVENLELKGNGRKGGNLANGLAFVRTRNSSVEHLAAEGFQKSGVDLYDCSFIQVKDALAYNNGFCGINIMGSGNHLSKNIFISGSKAENNPGDPTMLDNHSGNGILVGASDSVTIDHCSATNNGWDMPRQGNGPVGIWAWESDHVTIQYCISYRNKTSRGGKDGGGFDLDGGVTNSLIQYCLSYENEGAGYGLFQYSGASDWSNNTIRYCLSINDARTTEGAGSFFIWNGSNESSQLNNCMIYNNVIYSDSVPVISYENSSAHKNIKFSNNIFFGSGEIIGGVNSGSSFIGNTWWSSGKDIRFKGFRKLAEWAKSTGQEMVKGQIVGIQTDPRLTGPFITEITDPYQLGGLKGYTLKPDSPLRNKGMDLKSLLGIDPPIYDFYGNPLPLGVGAEPGVHQIK